MEIRPCEWILHSNDRSTVQPDIHRLVSSHSAVATHVQRPFISAGSRLWWYGFAPKLSGIGPFVFPAPAFSIDGGAPSSIQLPSNNTLSQSFVFKTPILPYATHSLTVIFHSVNQSNSAITLPPVPFTLQSDIIQKSIQGAVAPISSSDSLASKPTNTSKLPTSSPKIKHSRTVSIAGGIG